MEREEQRKALKAKIRAKRNNRSSGTNVQSNVEALKNQMLMETTEPQVFNALKDAKSATQYKSILNELQTTIQNASNQDLKDQDDQDDEEEELPPLEGEGLPPVARAQEEPPDEEALPPLPNF